MSHFIMNNDSYYKYHVFFCTNQREQGQACCATFGTQDLRDYMKKQVKELGLVRQGVRINTAGCLNRCDKGPVMVVYPQAIWYTFIDESDIDEIIAEHIVKGHIVKRLQVEE